METLTPRQEECLRFIRAYVKRHGISPSYRELCVALGIKSTSQVCYIVDALTVAGYVRRERAVVNSRHRCIELVETKDYHAADCSCGVCAEARYLAQRKLIEAIQTPLPASLIGKRLHGLAPVSELTKVYWLKGFPRSLRAKSGAAA